MNLKERQWLSMCINEYKQQMVNHNFKAIRINEHQWVPTSINKRQATSTSGFSARGLTVHGGYVGDVWVVYGRGLGVYAGCVGSVWDCNVTGM